MELFNVMGATESWLSLSAKYSHKYHKTLSAWSRLSYHMRHSYSPYYDGGLLRVIAFFGEAFPEYYTKDSVYFSPGPMSCSITSTPNSDDSDQRYLLLSMAKMFVESEHLHSYIKEYTNAWHRDIGHAHNQPMFEALHELLLDELNKAEQKHDYQQYFKLMELSSMMNALSKMRF